MSNYPPQPPQQPPYGQQPYQPPGGYGQQTPPQQQFQGGYVMQPQQSNGWAITALITGIVGGCIPGLGGLLAMIFGYFGIKRSRVSNSGKGMAIAGLVLGLLSIIGWGIFGGVTAAVYYATKPTRAAASSYIYAMDAGTVSTTEGDGPTQKAIDDYRALVPKGAKITDVTTLMSNVVNDDAEVVGIISFSTGEPRGFTAKEKKVNGVWKIEEMTILNEKPKVSSN